MHLGAVLPHELDLGIEPVQAGLPGRECLARPQLPLGSILAVGESNPENGLNIVIR